MVPSMLIASLATAANIAVDNALLHGARGQKRPTGEVGFVAAVVLGAIPDIAAAWRPILHPHGYSARFTGVFCHQAPMVRFTDTSGRARRCELSDLLVVVDDLTGHAPGRRWAVLVQAKIAKIGGGKSLSGTQDLAQLDLMTHFPPFALPATYAPGNRDFSNCLHAGATIDCGRYGLISTQPVTQWNQQAPALSMPAGGDQLGSFIAGMVETGQTHFGREATGMADDWSRTVEELITVSSAQAFNYAAGFSGSQPRNVTAIAFVVDPYHASYPFPLLPYPSYFYNGGDLPTGGRPDDPEGPGDEREGGGISFLRIGIGRAEEG